MAATSENIVFGSKQKFPEFITFHN